MIRVYYAIDSYNLKPYIGKECTDIDVKARNILKTERIIVANEEQFIFGKQIKFTKNIKI